MLSSFVLVCVISMIYITVMLLRLSRYTTKFQFLRVSHTTFYKLEKADIWASWIQIAGEKAGKEFWSNMDLTWDLSRGKFCFFLLATGARQLRRKQSIIYLNMFQWNSFFLATISYLKITDRSHAVFSFPNERCFKYHFQCL